MSIRLQLRVNDSRFARVAGKGNEIAPGHDASAARGVRRAAADRHHHLQYAGADRRVRAAEARRGLPVAKKAVKPLHHGAGLAQLEQNRRSGDAKSTT